VKPGYGESYLGPIFEELIEVVAKIDEMIYESPI